MTLQGAKQAGACQTMWLPKTLSVGTEGLGSFVALPDAVSFAVVGELSAEAPAVDTSTMRPTAGYEPPPAILLKRSRGGTPGEVPRWILEPGTSGARGAGTHTVGPHRLRILLSGPGTRRWSPLCRLGHWHLVVHSPR